MTTKLDTLRCPDAVDLPIEVDYYGLLDRLAEIRQVPGALDGMPAERFIAILGTQVYENWLERRRVWCRCDGMYIYAAPTMLAPRGGLAANKLLIKIKPMSVGVILWDTMNDLWDGTQLNNIVRAITDAYRQGEWSFERLTAEDGAPLDQLCLVATVAE